ncbi:MAG: U32 family peptidase [Angelakisella sp.]|nr:U32 family peptidase [Angelakisella sp.]
MEKRVNKMPEVLAPAGDMEKLKAALLYGADAVYVGGKLHTMRAGAGNFTVEELKEAVTLAHAVGTKVYFTVNTLPLNNEIAGLEQYLKEIASTGIDAFIVADIGMMMAAKRAASGVELHISTQAGITNYLTANELYNLGAKRVILARELDLESIRGIRQNTPPDLDIEYFVHGAMCMSFSGRCLLSNYMLGRDANRGECAQPCRWGYHLVEEKRPGVYYPIYEDEKGSYILNAKDMCLIEHIDKLHEAGVTSLKIEGRAKSAYYAAVITNAYRCAVDLYAKEPQQFKLPDWLLEETRKVSHRDYVPGFLFGRPDDAQCYQSGGYIREWDVVAVVQKWEDGVAHCLQRNKFYNGDTLEALIPKSGPVELMVQELKDAQGNELEHVCHAAMEFTFDCPVFLPEGTLLRKQKLD